LINLKIFGATLWNWGGEIFSIAPLSTRLLQNQMPYICVTI